jgi:predicted enzyme involved in methoxymalonyl-ACP biosynthesis
LAPINGVEQSFLSTIFDVAYQKGLKMITASYSMGQRKGQVKSFLLKMGFDEKQSNVLETEVVNIPDKPKYIKIFALVPSWI